MRSAATGKIVFAFVACTALFLDLWTKARYFRFDAMGVRKEVIKDFFYISSASNSGGVFSVLENRTTLLVILSILALLVVGVILIRLKGRALWLHIGLALIVGGALGNLYDRVILVVPTGERAHFVRDFILTIFWGYEYPVFNVADVCICVGAAMIALKLILTGERKHERKPQPEA